MWYGDELIAEQFPPPGIDDLLTVGGFLLISAPPKAGKSSFVLDMACSLAAGDCLWIPHWRPPEPWRVLILDQENGKREMNARLKALASIRSFNTRNIRGESKNFTLRLDEIGGRIRIRNLIKDSEPHVVILDPLQELHGKDENSASDMGTLMLHLQQMLEETQTRGILLHHSRKPQDAMLAPNPVNSARGSSAITGAASGIVSIDSNVEQCSATLRFRLRHDAEVTKMKFHYIKDTHHFERINDQATDMRDMSAVRI